MVFVENSYAYTNLVDLVLSNNGNVPNSHPVYIESATDETLSYGEFKTLVRQATAGFKKIGMKQGDCLCISTPNNINVPSIILGVLGAGGHLSPSNPTFTLHELEKQLIASKAQYVVAHPFNLDTALAAAKLVGIPSSNVWSIIKDPRNRAPEWKSVIVNSKDEAEPIKFTQEQCKNTLAYVCFSSGTTGPPKGVMISHHNFIANTLELNESLKPSKTYLNNGPMLAIVPLFHIMGLFRFVHLSLYQGRTVVLMAQYDLKQMCHMIQKHKISSMYVVPPMLLHLINYPQIVDQYDFSTIEAFHVGAAPVSESLSEAVRQKFNIPVLQGYGLTETASVLTLQTPENYLPNSVGRMIGGIDAKVVDENGNDLPAGKTGEICIKGPIVMKGYLDNPKATTETIDTNGYLHTGDVGYVDQLGNWFIVDRCKEMIKFNAFQIAPAELEDVLLNCPLVADAAVIGVFDEERQTEVPRAYITLSPNNAKIASEMQTIKDIHAFVNAKVVHYKQLRGGIEFIDVVPKSVAGKILRKDLRELYKKKRQTVKAKL